MSEKPSYLGLLNAISLAETRACEYLMEWIDVTPSPEVRRVLVTVAELILIVPFISSTPYY